MFLVLVQTKQTRYKVLTDLFHSTYSILTHHSRKGTDETSNTNNGFVPLSVPGSLSSEPRCTIPNLAHLNLNGIHPSLLLITRVPFLLWHDKMPVVKKWAFTHAGRQIFVLQSQASCFPWFPFFQLHIFNTQIWVWYQSHLILSKKVDKYISQKI